MFLLFEFFCGPLLHWLLLVVVVAYSILVSAQGPLVLGLGFLDFGAKGLGPGLDNTGRKVKLQY